MNSHDLHSSPLNTAMPDKRVFPVHDFISGFLIFLIALPLSIGIAKASNFPPMAGVVASIVGGLVVTFFQGSLLTIKGPAAGLIVIIYSCANAFGGGLAGYQFTLAVIVLSGIAQILLGLVGTGNIGDMFPSAVVQGMLASIGLMIIVRQTPILLGAEAYSDSFLAPLSSFWQLLRSYNPYITIIGIACLLLLFIYPFFKNRYLKYFPATMLVVLISVALGYFFNLNYNHQYTFVDGSTFNLGPDFLLNVPVSLWDHLAFPDFAKLFSPVTWKYVIMLVLVGSVESIASAKAVDILDPARRKSDLNKDLSALGIGNIICGFLGALPIINEIVRSSANIQNGAKTKWSNFYHALFLLIFVAFAATLLHRLPLTAMAALLIYTGFRLCTPRLFVEMYNQGTVEFTIFLVTIILSFLSDSLTGIIGGTALNFMIHLYVGAPLKSMFSSNITVLKNDKEKSYILYIDDATLFSNFNSLKNRLDSISAGYSIIIDFSKAKVVDNTAMEHLHYYGEDYQKTGGSLLIRGMENLQAWSAHPLSLRVARKATDVNDMLSTPRENQLKILGKKFNFKYLPHTPDAKNIPLRQYEAFVQIKYEANVLVGKIEGCAYRISDISFHEVTGMKPGITQFTVLVISDLQFFCPVFTMYEEGLMDKFLEFTLLRNEDIDFKDFPAISNKYLLKGIDEIQIRNFFTSKILAFLEKNPTYFITSIGHSLIIYKTKSIASFEEINDTLEFAQSFVACATLEHSNSISLT